MNPYVNTPVQSTYVSQYVPEPLAAIDDTAKMYGRMVDSYDTSFSNFEGVLSTQSAIPLQEEQELVKERQQFYKNELDKIANEGLVTGRLKGLKTLSSRFLNDPVIKSVSANKKIYDDYVKTLEKEPEANQLINESLNLYKQNKQVNPNATFEGILPIKRDDVITKTTTALSSQGLFELEESTKEYLSEDGTSSIKAKQTRFKNKDNNWETDRINSAKQYLSENYINQYRHDAMRMIARGEATDLNKTIQDLINTDAQTIVLNQLERETAIPVSEKPIISKVSQDAIKKSKEVEEFLRNSPNTKLSYTANNQALTLGDKTLETLEDIQQNAAEVDETMNSPLMQSVISGQDDLVEFDAEKGIVKIREGITDSKQLQLAQSKANNLNSSLGKAYQIQKIESTNILNAAKEQLEKEYKIDASFITFNDKTKIVDINTNLADVELDKALKEIASNKNDNNNLTSSFFGFFGVDVKGTPDEENPNIIRYKRKNLGSKTIIDTKTGIPMIIPIDYVDIGYKMPDGSVKYIAERVDAEKSNKEIIGELFHEKIKTNVEDIIESNYKQVKMTFPKINLGFLSTNKNLEETYKGLKKTVFNSVATDELPNGSLQAFIVNDKNGLSPYSIPDDLWIEDNIEFLDYLPVTDTGEAGLVVRLTDKNGKRSGEPFMIRGPELESIMETITPGFKGVSPIIRLAESVLGSDITTEQGDYMEQGTITMNQLNEMGFLSSTEKILSDEKGNAILPFDINLSRLANGQVVLTTQYSNTDAIQDPNIIKPEENVEFESDKIVLNSISELPQVLVSLRKRAVDLAKQHLKINAGSELDAIFNQQFDMDLENVIGLIGSLESGNKMMGKHSDDPELSVIGKYGFTIDTFNRIKSLYSDIIPADSTHAQLEYDPNLNDLAVKALTIENSRYLSKNNVPVTPINIYLSHFLSPYTTKLINQDPPKIGETFAEYMIRKLPRKTAEEFIDKNKNIADKELLSIINKWTSKMK